MKRIFFIIATSTLMSIAAQAQQPAKTFSITPKVGISVGGLTGDPFFNTATVVYMWPSSFDQSADDLRTPEISSHSTQKHSTQIGFAGGIEAQYQFNRYLGIVLGQPIAMRVWITNMRILHFHTSQHRNLVTSISTMALRTQIGTQITWAFQSC